MTDIEKNAGKASVTGEDLASVLLRHTHEYDLYVATLNPTLKECGGHGLKKALSSRQVSMIALGGALGTGLLIGTGSALKAAGPGAIFVAYSAIGFVVFMVMTALGEVAAFIPLNGFANYCQRYVDDALGFACGYVYLFKYLILPANQLVAGSMTMQYWVKADRVNPAIWVLVFHIVILIINLAGVRFFGEIEFWISSIKVITCLGLILLLWIIALGGGPNNDHIGFRYWKNPGAFLEFSSGKDFVIHGSKGRFVAFVSVLVTAVFAYLGTELVGITFAETRNPRKSIPKAIRLTFYRIVVFYVLSILFLGMSVSPRDPLLMSPDGNSSSASASPFVIAIRNANISGLPHVINAAILLFVLSAANSDMYVCSRTIYSLAVAGYAPKFFLKTNRMGVPYYGIALSFAFCCLAYMTASDDARTVFNYFVNVVSLTGLIAWSCILVIHLRFMKALKVQGFDRTRDLAYKSPLQPYGSYAALFICVLIIFIKNFTVFIHKFDYKNFITGYIVLPVFVIMYFGWKIIFKTKIVRAEDIDLDTFRDVIDAEAIKFDREDEERAALMEAEGKNKWTNPKFLYEKVFGWIF